jgi:uncharacterized protein DUF1524/excalibur calcium-binding domain-containing protein
VFSRGKAGWWLLGVVVGLWLLGHSGTDHASRAPSATPAGATRDSTPDPDTNEPASSPTPTPAAHQRPGSALAALAALPVKGRAPMTGYTRERFGQAWLDADRNGCDTRNDILGRDVLAPTYKPGTRSCVVLTGTLPDPYLGSDIAFARGADDQVDIDHVVALGNAWATGADRFDVRRRAALANDPLNLLAVDLHSNRSKGDGDAATWLPPSKRFRCAYVARQIAVKAKYGLWVTPPERDAMARVLSSCPRQPLPRDRTHAPTSVDQHLTDPGAPASPQPLGLVGGATTYENCDAVRAAGAAPIRVGQPGYSRNLDRDGDGVGCE